MLLDFIKKTNITSRTETFISLFLTLHFRKFSVSRLKEYTGESILLYKKYYLVIYSLTYLLPYLMLNSKHYFLIFFSWAIAGSKLVDPKSELRWKLYTVKQFRAMLFSFLYQNFTALTTLLWYIHTYKHAKIRPECETVTSASG